MKEKIIKAVIFAMAETLNGEQLKKLENVLTKTLQDVDCKETEKALTIPAENWQRILREYFISLKVEGRSETTIKQYQRTLCKFFIFVGKPLREITTHDIRLFLFGFEERGGSKSYMDTQRRVLSAFFTWAHDESFIRKNPCRKVKKIRTPQIIKKPFTRVEREALTDACETLRDKALLATLYSTACRVGELISLNRSDVNLTERTIKVYGSKGKAERTVCINDACYYYLTKYLSERTDDNDALFVTHKRPNRRISKECVQHTLKEIGKRAGVSNVHPHRFRRTMLTDMANVSIPVQHIMKYAGHKDMNTTMIYVNCTEQRVGEDFMHYMANA